MEAFVAKRVRDTGALLPLSYLVVALVGLVFAGGCLLLLALGAPPVLGVLAVVVLVPVVFLVRYALWLWANTRVEIRVDREGIEVINKKRSIKYAWHELSEVSLVSGPPNASPALALEPLRTPGSEPGGYARLIRFLTGRLPGGTIVPAIRLDCDRRTLAKAIDERADRLQVTYRRTLTSFIPDTSDISSTSY